MANVVKYVRAHAVAQLKHVATLFEPLMNQQLPGDVFDDLTASIAKLSGITIADITKPVIGARPVEFGELIGHICSEFALNCAPETAYSLLKELTNYQPKIETSTRPNGLLLAQNQMLIGQVVRCSALMGMAYVITQLNYDLRSEALQKRADIAELIKFELLDLQDFETSELLKDFRNKAVAHLSSIIKTLSTIIEVENVVELPSLLLAYDIYGDVDKVDNLIKMNAPKNAFFMPPKIEAAV